MPGSIAQALSQALSPNPVGAGVPGDGATAAHLYLSIDTLGAEPLAAAERELIRQALTRSSGNKKEAARLLGISRFALQRRLDKLALDFLQMGRS